MERQFIKVANVQIRPIVLLVVVYKIQVYG